MSLNSSNAILAQAPAMQQNPAVNAIMGPVTIAIMIGMVYFMLIRPQQKRTRELNNLLKTIKPGDKIVTGSGIVGTVVSVKDKTIAIRSAETKLEVLKSAVTEITERSGEPVEA